MYMMFERALVPVHAVKLKRSYVVVAFLKKGSLKIGNTFFLFLPKRKREIKAYYLYAIVLDSFANLRSRKINVLIR